MNTLSHFLALLTAGLVFGCSGSAVPEPVSNGNQEANEAGSDERRVAELAVELAAMQAAVSTETRGRFLWEKQQRPYVVVGFVEKNYMPGGVQHRNVRVAMPTVSTKADVESVAQEIYLQLTADIEATQPDASHKRVNILLYDSVADAVAFDGGQIFQIVTSAEPNLPSWEDAPRTWWWRDPAARPSSESLIAFEDYQAGLKDCRKVSELPFHDANGVFVGSFDDQKEIDRCYAHEKRKLALRLAAKYGVSTEQLARRISEVWLWRQGINLTESAITADVESYLEEWKEE